MLLLRLHPLSFLIIFFFFIFPISYSIPFIVIHGIGNHCSSDGLKSFTKELITYSGVQGSCVEVGNGELDSWFIPMLKQTDIVCQKVKKMKELKGGYNIVSISQGTLIGRGVVEFCEGGPPVKNFISLGGPQAGTTLVPLCKGDFCKDVDKLFKGLLIYNNLTQEHLAPSGYLKFPEAIHKYLEYSSFLPKLNNEKPHQRNSTYKERFSSLKNLVLIMSMNDTALKPKETSWFGYYRDGKSKHLLQPKETKLYTEDWIGLRSLDEAGRVHFISIPGEHVDISKADMKKHIAPYLKG